MTRDQQEDTQIAKKLFRAARVGDLEKVKQFIESGKLPPTIYRGNGLKEETLAHVAAKNGHLNTLQYLVEKEPSLVTNSSGYWLGTYDHPTVLETAVAYDHLDIVKYLVENHDGDIFQRRLLNYRSEYCRTPVSMAISRGHLDITKYFIEERRANVDTGEPNEKLFHGSYKVEPLLFRAVRFKRHNIAKYLIEERNANLYLLDKNKQNILYPAVYKKDLNFIKYILDERKAKIDINWRDKDGKTLLHVAVFEKCLDILKYLVEEKKADVNVPDTKVQRTPSYWAIRRSNYDIFKFLVDHGANLEKKDGDGNTPLHWAVESPKGVKICEYLVEHGANIKQENNEGKTPLDIAIVENRPKLVKYLIERMNDIDGRNDKGETLVHKVASLNDVELLDYLVRKKHAKVNVARKEDLWTPLHCAAFWNHHETCKYLIEQGADPQAKDKMGRKPAQVASNKKVIQYIQNASASMKTRSRRSVSDSSIWIPALEPEPREYKFDRIDGDLLGRVTISLDKTPAFHFDSFLLITNFLIRYLFLSNFTPPRAEERKLVSNEEEILQNRIDPVAEDAIHTFLDVDEHDHLYN